jgi:hypothetical protein
MDRKKELKEKYKQMKTDMGVFIIRSNFSNKCYIEGTQDLKGTINGTKFKLGFGNHPNKGLQEDWKQHGEAGFMIEIIGNLEYDKDGVRTDYSEDITLLQMIWEDRMLQQGFELYKK